MDKIRVGISECLLGSKVRYDGQHKRDHYITDILGKYFEWVHSCPEHDCGLPIPRESMRLIGDKDFPRLVTGKTKHDFSDKLTTWSEKRLLELADQNLCGYILKKGSPSCGMTRVKVYSEAGIPSGFAPGMFAKMLFEKLPYLPVEDEGRLNDSGLRENFIERVFVYDRWKKLVKDDISLKNLVKFHTAHKYLIMAHDPKRLKSLGQIVASARPNCVEKSFDEYFPILMETMKLKATVSKNVNVLEHIFGYFKKQLTNDEKSEVVEIIKNYHKSLIPLIVPVTLLKHYVRKYNQEYLKDQLYLAPHPLELMLRNHA